VPHLSISTRSLIICPTAWWSFFLAWVPVPQAAYSFTQNPLFPYLITANRPKDFHNLLLALPLPLSHVTFTLVVYHTKVSVISLCKIAIRILYDDNVLHWHCSLISPWEYWENHASLPRSSGVFAIPIFAPDAPRRNYQWLTRSVTSPDRSHNCSEIEKCWIWLPLARSPRSVILKICFACLSNRRSVVRSVHSRDSSHCSPNQGWLTSLSVLRLIALLSCCFMLFAILPLARPEFYLDWRWISTLWIKSNRYRLSLCFWASCESRSAIRSIVLLA
jgi:hypothetical protein